jgi:hypothetical protein
MHTPDDSEVFSEKASQANFSLENSFQDFLFFLGGFCSFLTSKDGASYSPENSCEKTSED